MQSRAGWRKADQVRKIKIVMTVIAITLCISVASGGILFWVQLKHPFSKPVSVSVSGTDKEASSQSGVLPVYDDSYNLVVVNASTQIKSDFQVQPEQFQGITVDTRIIPALRKMMEDAKSAGCPLKLTKGYVEKNEQDKLFTAAVQDLMKNQSFSQVRAENQVQNTVGRGGYNENQTGMAVEFAAEGEAANADFSATAQYKWLVKNSVHYGFVLRYTEAKTSVTGMPFNPRHFRYVGSENAVKMREYSMCLEEFSAYIRKQNPN
ncbi:M15 family metallopeptidase [Caproiciproducens faecalis]|uniref:M15 family metallopeptidase n=1 Tax=Caproiciproducens faecalis TaxID=2820301 RepID=A0ABS7DRI0_9FIRM|nr:M15 family metallopeptidase [Caproiciproducens faecalis]MBW7573425.1 M15 family metallopeptidase [Caproiciproducens faecalis]